MLFHKDGINNVFIFSLNAVLDMINHLKITICTSYG